MASLGDVPLLNRKLLVVPPATHDEIVGAAFKARGYNDEEVEAAVSHCRRATHHGVSSHNGIKALHVDDIFGTGRQHSPGCVPGAVPEVLSSRFSAVQRWDARRASGFKVARDAMEAAMAMAESHGIGCVSVDNAFHYCWGAGFVMEAASRGYIAFTTCTGAIPEVVPPGGKAPTMGTNPHTWAFPTKDAIGFDFVMDWATSVMSKGAVQAYLREGRPLPEGVGVDVQGAPTTDPTKVAGMLPFGGHKGFGLCVVTELLAAYGGCGLPTLRCGGQDGSGRCPDGEKETCHFFFQCIHPEAIAGASFAQGRSQSENVAAVLKDILGHGNEEVHLSGKGKFDAARRSEQAGGLLFTPQEVEALKKHADAQGIAFDVAALREVSV